MRRALLPWLPAFSHVFGIKPWEVDQLTPLEKLQFQGYLSQMNAES